MRHHGQNVHASRQFVAARTETAFVNAGYSQLLSPLNFFLASALNSQPPSLNFLSCLHEYMIPPTAPHLQGTPPSIFASYPASNSGYDEMFDQTGAIRPHWGAFAQQIEALGIETLQERHENAQQLLRDHGVTFNVYANGRSDERPWDLDMFPLLISAKEWTQLEAGLIQRTRLLNLILADIYGPQLLLRDGLLPPAILQANPGFIRPCHGLTPAGGRFLTLHAVDLTRAPDGQWWVLTDRTQAPSGVGYTLENRIILSRVLPEEFRAANVQRLASFFLARKAGLRAMAPWTDSPNVVLLTPGPYAETYFEHAYLARYLGYHLVEGSDLTVRDRRVFIKTLEGLQRVDVIIRHVDDTFCDPLELRTDSFLGVPGLVEAARAGSVAISNALGSGAVEAPALLAFLPSLSRHLLNEELKIPNVATWWCGQQREREYTLHNLGSLVMKRAFVNRSGEPLFGESMDSTALERVTGRIRVHPHDFVGQERVALSTAPVWKEDRLEPRPLILRCYVCATPNGFTVLPGGLTRVSPSADHPVVTSKHGGGSKDTWVLSEGPVEAVTLLDKRGLPMELHRSAAAVPSRVVDNLFWLGRYAERLEDTARLLRTILSRIVGEAGTAEEAELVAMTECIVRIQKLPATLVSRSGNPELMDALRKLVFDEDSFNSVQHLLNRIAFLTESLRDRFSGDTWRILHHLQKGFLPAPAHANAAALLASLHRLIVQLAAFSGMEMENMTRGHAWRFLEIGRRLERARNVLETVRAVTTADPTGNAVLVPLLEYTDSTMTYRRRYLARPELPMTLDLLLADRTNPRSFAFQLSALGEHLHELPGSNPDQSERRAFLEIDSLLNATDFLALGAAACASDPKPLDDLLGRLIAGCFRISDLLTVHYFSHVLPRSS